MPESFDRPPRFRRRTVVLATIAAGVVLVGVAMFVIVNAGSGGDEAGPPLATTTTTTLPPDRAAPGSPAITAFGIPKSVRCDQATTIRVSWATTGAVGVQIAIDGPGAFGYYPPTGVAQVPFPCDDIAHVYQLIAVAPSGALSSRTTRVEQIS